MDIPRNLNHKPIIAVDYEAIDEAGDAKFLSIGKAQWNNSDLSAKVFRYDDANKKWSRQSEELPLWRVLDLAKLVIASISDQRSDLDELVIDSDSKMLLRDYIMENLPIYAPRIKEIQRLIQNSLAFGQQTSRNFAPNIFNLATSELSQDAILAWMLQWGDPKYMDIDRGLYELGINLIRKLLGDSNYQVNTIEVGRQWKNIDIWAEINDDTVIIIEDKTVTTIHDNQIERYKKIVEDEYVGKRDKLHYAYIKTGNEPQRTLDVVAQAGYMTLNRKELLDILYIYNGKNAIVNDFRSYLQDIENKTNAYLTSPIAEWDGYAWEGFYKYAELRLKCFDWSYVANPSGGFLGGWWHSHVVQDKVEMYLQFEESRLCFKISCEGFDNKSKLRDKYMEKLFEIKGDNYPEIIYPYRRGTGNCMTIAIVEIPNNFTSDGILELDKLFTRIKEYESLVVKCSQE